IIGNHSYHHPDFTSLNKSEIKQELDYVQEAVEEITGNDSMKYVRPPRGTFNEETLKWTEELGYDCVFWSLAFKDWESNKQKVEKEITGNDRMKYVRHTRGKFNEETLKWTEELGYVSVFWSLAFKDWERNKQKGEMYAYEQIMDQIHPGAIILLHTVSEDNA